MKKSINPLWGGRFEKEGTDLLKKLIIQFLLTIN